MSMTRDHDAVAAQLLAIREQLTTKVWSTAGAAATSGDLERVRVLVMLKVDIEAIVFALGHRPAGRAEGDER